MRDAIATTLQPEPNEGEDMTVDNDVVVEPTLSAFQDHLLALPANWDAVIALARRQQLPQLLETLAQDLASPPAAAESADEPAQQKSAEDRPGATARATGNLREAAGLRRDR